MFQILTHMGALILSGISWRALRPFGHDADTTRHAITGLVYVLLLPALVLEVLWKAPLGGDAIRLAFTAASGILICMFLAWLAYRITNTPKPIAGALILAAAFPNATYMGLPVLEHLLGPQGRGIALQFDLFACTPLLLSVGILLASAYGEHKEKAHPLQALLKVPPLWAAALAISLNLADVPIPEWVDEWLTMLSASVVPLMLIALGMSLRWSAWKHHYLLLLVPVILLQLFVMPATAMLIGKEVGLDGDLLTGTVLEAAMPSMVLGLVLCDRYGLNTGLFAIAVTLTTALTLMTLPLWFGWAT